jgi:hypothetical protein
MAPITDLDGVRWNGGAWFGCQIGGTAWMLTASVAYVWQAPWLGVLFLLAFAGVNVLGVWLWRHRSRLRFFRRVQLMTLLCGGLALLALVAFDFLPSGNLKHDLTWQGGQPRWVGANRSEFRNAYLLLLILVPALLIQFEVLGRQARRRSGSAE